MSVASHAGQEVRAEVLNHLIDRIHCTPAIGRPFGHIYLEDVFPPDIYECMLQQLPRHELYGGSAERYAAQPSGEFVRWIFQLTDTKLRRLSEPQQELWRGVAAALTAPELKRALFEKLAPDLAFRYGVPESSVGELPAFSRPVLYRETAGFEIPPHPDTRKKIVTMQFYLPADRGQIDLGTALYRRRLLSWPFGPWQNRFVKVKQFSFQPNSAYAFVVNNTLSRKSWHGREKLPNNAGIRNTLLNTFYTEERKEFSHYLPLENGAE